MWGEHGEAVMPSGIQEKIHDDHQEVDSGGIAGQRNPDRWCGGGHHAGHSQRGEHHHSRSPQSSAGTGSAHPQRFTPTRTPPTRPQRAPPAKLPRTTTPRRTDREMDPHPLRAPRAVPAGSSRSSGSTDHHALLPSGGPHWAVRANRRQPPESRPRPRSITQAFLCGA